MNKNVQHLHHVLSEGVQITKWTYSATFKKVFVSDESENLQGDYLLYASPVVNTLINLSVLVYLTDL